MKKILFFVAMFTLLLLTACGGKAEDLQVQVDDLQTQLEDSQGELDLAESAVGLCVASLEEEITTTSGLTDTFAGALSDLATCQEEIEALSIGPEAGGGGEEADEIKCAGTERILMMSTPVLQQAVDKNGKPKYNHNDLMIMVAIPNSRVEDFIAGDVVCVTEHYPVAGGWAVFLISGTREANFNLFIPAHYFEPLPGETPPFAPSSCHPSYPTVCIPFPPPNLNCPDVFPLVNFQVVGSDPHGFDGFPKNGIGCEE